MSPYFRRAGLRGSETARELHAGFVLFRGRSERRFWARSATKSDHEPEAGQLESTMSPVAVSSRIKTSPTTSRNSSSRRTTRILAVGKNASGARGVLVWISVLVCETNTTHKAERTFERFPALWSGQDWEFVISQRVARASGCQSANILIRLKQ